MDPRIQKALSRLDHGSYSLTIDGFGRRALGKNADPRDIIQAMRSTELPERRVPGPNGMVTVWDYDAP